VYNDDVIFDVLIMSEESPAKMAWTVLLDYLEK
jgi:hypothetical protein